MLSDEDRRMIEESLERIAQRRGVPFSEEHYDVIAELLGDPFFGAALPDMAKKDQTERDQWVESLLRLSLMENSDSLPVPEAITAEVLSDTQDEALPQLLYDFVCEYLDRAGFYQAESDREILHDLPRGLLIVYLLTALDGEISNGGFSQFFTNSSGDYVPETLRACTLAGYDKHRQILEQAIEVWEPARRVIEMSDQTSSVDREAWDAITAEITPQLEKLDSAYYEAENSEPFGDVIASYVRKHPDECLAELPAAVDGNEDFE